MMFIGIGTAINIVAILIGSLLGVLVGARIKAATRELITDVLGLITLISGAAAIVTLWSDNIQTKLPKGWPFLVVLGSLLIGGILGSALNIENRLMSFGEFLKQRLAGKDRSNFVEGFITAALVFAIGPLAILGSISDGMETGIDQLILKSVLDLFASIAFAASFGWGVAASAIPVGIYQVGWTLLGLFLGSILSSFQIDMMTAVGGVLLLGIGMRLLNIRQIAVGNLLPALFIAPILAQIVFFLS